MEDTLDAESADAWTLYQRLASRFAMDAGIVPELFRRLVADWSTEAVVDAVARIGVIHDVLSPPAPPSKD